MGLLEGKDDAKDPEWPKCPNTRYLDVKVSESQQYVKQCLGFWVRGFGP